MQSSPADFLVAILFIIFIISTLSTGVRKNVWFDLGSLQLYSVESKSIAMLSVKFLLSILQTSFWFVISLPLCLKLISFLFDLLPKFVFSWIIVHIVLQQFCDFKIRLSFMFLFSFTNNFWYSVLSFLYLFLTVLLFVCFVTQWICFSSIPFCLITGFAQRLFFW